MISPGVSTASNTSQATRPGASAEAEPFGDMVRARPPDPFRRTLGVDQGDGGGVAGFGLVQPLLAAGLALGQPVSCVIWPIRK